MRDRTRTAMGSVGGPNNSEGFRRPGRIITNELTYFANEKPVVPYI